ncbi:MAG: hypothetical protein F9K24_22225 [Leptonema illini]|uniref:Uncharacterized protein n=1 Tax=Leptonema illini TaxID=183 RepID=A0A833GW70_9LEPT|nr:MAG: hypothetical protein F9K24_22225 [Leptonema illini]
MSKTTEYDHAMKQAFKILDERGKVANVFYGKGQGDYYRRGVQPDFISCDGYWIDFKLTVSYREKSDVPWRPSSLYTSLRKYIDHPENQHAMLDIVYGGLFGRIEDVVFPILRGRKILLASASEFQHRIRFIPAREAIKPLARGPHEALYRRIVSLVDSLSGAD